jgi:D-amino-acid dehydrogenase
MSTTRRADAVVIGAGAIGMSSAWSLARRGLQTIVIERSTRLGDDTAAGSGGLITPSHCVPLAGAKVLRQLPRQLLRRDSMISLRPRLDPDLARFAIHALRRSRPAQLLAGLRALRDQARVSRGLFADLAAHGIDIDLEHSGVLNVCNTAEGFDDLLAEAQMLEREGFAPRILEGVQVAAVEPAIRPDVAGAVLWDEDDQCIPARLTPALGQACATLGVDLRLATKVLGFDQAADGTVYAVRTDHGPVATGAVVIAAGARTPRVARALGAHVPIQAGTGHHVTVHDSPIQVHVPMILNEDVLGVTSMGPDLRLVGGMDFIGLDPEIDLGRIDDIYTRVARYLRQPPRRDEGRATVWCGMRPCAPDGLPIIGRLRSAPNTVVATGHGMLGLTLAPATGNDVSALVAGDRQLLRDAPWLEQFTPKRFGL